MGSTCLVPPPFFFSMFIHAILHILYFSFFPHSHHPPHGELLLNPHCHHHLQKCKHCFSIRFLSTRLNSSISFFSAYFSLSPSFKLLIFIFFFSFLLSIPFFVFSHSFSLSFLFLFWMLSSKSFICPKFYWFQTLSIPFSFTWITKNLCPFLSSLSGHHKCQRNPPHMFTSFIYNCWVEGCSLVGTCPTSYNFFLSSLFNIYLLCKPYS